MTELTRAAGQQGPIRTLAPVSELVPGKVGPGRPRRAMLTKLHIALLESLKHGFLWLILLFAFFPFVFMVYSSLKTDEAIRHHVWRPPVSMEDLNAKANYALAWKVVAPYVGNSLLVTAATVIGVMIVAVLAAYAFARYQFPGRQLFFYMIIALLMVPGVLTLIASFMWVRDLFWLGSVSKHLNLIDTYWVLILPGIAGAQVGAIFLCRGFFAALPAELFEAARMDGASDVQMIWHMVLPLSKPILGTVAVMNILATWNNFLWPLLVTGDKRMYTLAVGLRYFMGSFGNEYGPLFAGYTIASVPLIMLFLLTMRHFIAGLTSGAIKA